MADEGEQMNGDRLRRRLESAQAPAVSLPRARAALRRRLVGEADRAATSRRGGRLALAAAAAVVVLLLALPWLPQETTAAEVIRGMEAAYGADSVAGKVHYLRQLLRLPGETELEEEQWALPSRMQLRLLVRDARTEKVIGHTIADGERTWTARGSRVRAHRLVRETPLADRPEPGRPARGAPASRVRMVVAMSFTGETTGDGERWMQSFLMSDTFDTERFRSRTPQDVLDALLDEPDVTYTGVETDPETGQEYHVLERHVGSGPFPVKLEFPESYVTRLQERIGSGELDDVTRPDAFDGEVRVTPLEAFEIIHVSADSSRIRTVTLSALENGREVYRVEKVFLGEAYLEPSPSLFDPAVYDLEPVAAPSSTETEKEIP